MASFTSLNQFALACHRPVAQDGPQFVWPLAPRPQTAPTPVLGPADHIGRQGVPLHVAADRQEVLVLLDGKALETPLVQMPAR